MTFNLLWTMVMTYLHAKVQGQQSVGSGDTVETDRWRRCLLDSLRQSVIINNKVTGCTWQVNCNSTVTQCGNQLQRFYVVPRLRRKSHTMQEEHSTTISSTRWRQSFSVIYCHRLQQPCSEKHTLSTKTSFSQLNGINQHTCTRQALATMRAGWSPPGIPKFRKWFNEFKLVFCINHTNVLWLLNRLTQSKISAVFAFLLIGTQDIVL